MPRRQRHAAVDGPRRDAREPGGDDTGHPRPRRGGVSAGCTRAAAAAPATGPRLRDAGAGFRDSARRRGDDAGAGRPPAEVRRDSPQRGRLPAHRRGGCAAAAPGRRDLMRWGLRHLGSLLGAGTFGRSEGEVEERPRSEQPVEVARTTRSISRVDLSEPARLVSRRFATVCRLSRLATEADGKPSGRPTVTSCGIPRIVVVTSATSTLFRYA